jgi:hypothetical protein
MHWTRHEHLHAASPQATASVVAGVRCPSRAIGHAVLRGRVAHAALVVQTGETMQAQAQFLQRQHEAFADLVALGSSTYASAVPTLLLLAMVSEVVVQSNRVRFTQTKRTPYLKGS